MGILGFAGRCAFLIGVFAALSLAEKPVKIVFLAGFRFESGDHPPGTHEYEKSLTLLKDSIDALVPGVVTEIHTNGWPEDSTTLEDASTIVLFSEGADREETRHPFLGAPNRMGIIERQMKRGCGLISIHWSLFVPDGPVADKYTDWLGGYFDFTDGTGKRWSKIKEFTCTTKLPNPTHAVARGVKPFEVYEEWYYNIKFPAQDTRKTPIMTARVPGTTKDEVVGWALQRADGGRGFGFTGTHFLSNLQIEPFRKTLLNAIVWTAGMEVPANGVERNSSTSILQPLTPTDFDIASSGQDGWRIRTGPSEAVNVLVLDAGGKTRNTLRLGKDSQLMLRRSELAPGLQVILSGTGPNPKYYPLFLK